MITLGYGDIVPTTTIERIFVIWMTLFSCGIFGYALSSIGSIIKDLKDKNLEFQLKMNALKVHMK
jgi:hypothetical protein